MYRVRAYKPKIPRLQIKASVMRRRAGAHATAATTSVSWQDHQRIVARRSHRQVPYRQYRQVVISIDVPIIGSRFQVSRIHEFGRHKIEIPQA